MSATADAPDRPDATADDQLMLAYVGGDASAFDVLYARHESGIFRFVRRLLGVRLAAEVGELFQATWARIVSARDTFAPEESNWRVWAYAIGYELATEELRLSGREAAFYAHDEDGDGLEAAHLFGLGVLRGGPADAHPSVEELAFWRAAGRRLQACLDELSDAQRAAFLLHHEEGFTLEVVGRTLGVDAETAADRLRIGLDRLQDCMERYLSAAASGMSSDYAGTGDLHDPRLWRALEHAPDQGAVPDWRVRKEILRSAHAAIGEPDPEDAEAELERAAQSWWQRLAEGRAGREKSKRRWPVAVAAMMVAFVAIMLWRREPAPSPAPPLDDKTPVASNARTTEEPTPMPAPSASRPPPSDPSSIPLLPPSFFAKPELPAPEPEPESAPAPAPTPPAPPTRKTAVAPPAEAPSPPPKAQKAPQPPVPSLPPAASPPPPREAVASARPATAQAPPASSSVRTDETEPPSFEALGRWNQITISKRGGESRSLQRADAREISALMGSAALSAVGPQPLRGTPEWRVTLERGADVLAVFEVSGPQVRWREGRTPAATGTPSAGALSALRDALGRAVQAPQPAPGEPSRSP
ncbi:RNA polymerase sigma factor, sigma-70 family [Variovorax sp. HW608]|uniref:sigma-70 family RNA polymerase sigma factor n=1 Tax=Variovorax sp. HW608 TaxID=1034889 RepID=UPI00081FBA51|nr:sigma-70 family RNA polymerase sigma factor [Variovorax sp. HW608]SCK38584.1 RNA polymerase sigma factor, sigma-70 family [Variovorax sp. HW608]